ncbi:MAG: hypothetical protein ABI641_01955 [Caldimonas sp.]
MSFPSRSLRRVALLVLPPFAACASADYHLSQLTGQRYFKAMKANRLASTFDVRVDHRQTISGCTPPPAA